MFINKNLLWCIVSCSSSLVNGLVIPRSLEPNGGSILPRDDAATTSVAGGLPLRIMALGASITFGEGSTDGNGYRSDLRTALVNAGNTVNMVGSKPNGTMKDNDTEGWPGFIVDQVREKADASVPNLKPNLVLVNVGTNDCLQNVDIPNAGNRMRTLLNDVFDKSPRAAIVLSTLLVNGNADAQTRTTSFNTQLKSLTMELQLAGKALVLVDMQGTGGPTADELVDGTHPNDAGYQKMANLFLQGIRDADSRSFLQRAEVVSGIPDNGEA
ncbi:carbohydrate esterase family 3 protein [Whalleya microplaca]|nr:carbohydrate esterase family 3 protein [Whalleya microplaca]